MEQRAVVEEGHECSSSKTTCAGSSPATIRQKRTPGPSASLVVQKAEETEGRERGGRAILASRARARPSEPPAAKKGGDKPKTAQANLAPQAGASNRTRYGYTARGRQGGCRG